MPADCLKSVLSKSATVGAVAGPRAVLIDGHTSGLASQVDPTVADGRIAVCDGHHRCLW